jgi:hypothetical protein
MKRATLEELAPVFPTRVLTRDEVRTRTVLSLCDFSGRWSAPYREAGYNVVQVDLKLGQDARLFKRLDEPVHGILIAPLCTAFSGAGAKHWAAKEAEGNTQLLEGLALVDACLRIVFAHEPKWWVLENPVGRLKDWLGYHQHTFQPFEYAGYLGDEPTGRMVTDKDGNDVPEFQWTEDAYSKRTCLWGNFDIPDIDERPNVYGSKMWANYGGKSERTKEMRSMTPRGFSKAFFEANP